MPFCRKCGRRLPPYSESCPDCGTSTTAPIIKIKKASATANKFKAAAPTKIAKVVIPTENRISVKVIAPAKPAKTVAPAKVATAKASNPFKPTKPVAPPEKPPHEIKQSNISIEEDIITNPHDYETQPFGYDLKCPHGHFWREGISLPVSKGKAYCPECGERLRKPVPKGKKRYRTVGS